MMLFTDAVKFDQDWRTADRSSTGIAPPAKQVEEALVQVYSARAFNWRAMFAVHTWIATKPTGADAYTVHQVIGWRSWRNLPVVVSEQDIPDRSWYGAAPEIIAQLRGPAAEKAIARIEHAVARYPYLDRYRLWPGPNSNTFTAFIGRNVPELGLDLPPTAIGKDFLALGSFVAPTPSGTGVQFSLFGVFGVLLSRQEGIEINLLGLSFGLDPLDRRLRLPGLGTLG